MKQIIALLVTIVMTICLCACQGTDKDGSSSQIDSTSSSESDGSSSSDTEIEQTEYDKEIASELGLFYKDQFKIVGEVSYEQVKSILCGGYYSTASFYSYEFLFLENGEYIIFDAYGNRYTSDNSDIQYFLVNRHYGEAVLVSITRKDGTNTRAIVNEKAVEITDDYPVGIIKNDKTLREYRSENPSETFYTLNDFKNIKIGESGQNSSEFISGYHYRSIWLTADGDLMEFPMEDGRCIWVKFDENRVVSAIEVSDRPCEVYF